MVLNMLTSVLHQTTAAVLTATTALSGVSEETHHNDVVSIAAHGYQLTSGQTWSSQVLTGDVGGVWSSDSSPTSNDVALVLGPTGIPTPSDTYLQAVYNLYLAPSGLYSGPEEDVYSLTTPELSGNTETGLAADESAIKDTLIPLLESGHHVTLFGYSQSSAAVSAVLNQLTSEYGDKYADDVTFVLTGDSASPHGILANAYDSMPSWMQPILLDNAQVWGLGGGVMNLGGGEPPMDIVTPAAPYHGDVFTLSSGGTGFPYPDGYASWSPNSFTDGSDLWDRQLLGVFGTHVDYLGVTPGDISQALHSGDPGTLVNYLDLSPGQSEIELLTQSAEAAGWLPTWLGDFLLEFGL